LNKAYNKNVESQ